MFQRAIVVLVAAVLVGSCSTKPPCGPSNCTGCCASADVCVPPPSTDVACGSGGAVCDDCVARTDGLNVCVNDRCSSGAGGSGGSGGGAGGSGGGSGGAGGGGAQCFENMDCPDPQLFYCNTVTSTCQPGCRTRADCTAAVRGQYALVECSGTLGCNCDEGTCVAALCSVDGDCGTQVCRGGRCVAAPAASAVAKCVVYPDALVMPVGASAAFHVLALDSALNPVVVPAGATWSALDSSVSTSSPPGNSATFTAGSTPSASLVAAVQADFGGASCSARVLVVPAAAASGHVLAVVTDELTGRPVGGATVVVSDVGTGAELGSSSALTAGSYDVTVTGTPTQVTVTAFHPDFDYLTVASYPMSGSRVLSMPLRRNVFDQRGGYRGTFVDTPATANVHLGTAALSLPGSPGDISALQVFGPPVPTHVVVGTAINQSDVPVPATRFMGFSDQPIKSEVAALGLAGTCQDLAGAPDEARILAGSCGTRSAWGLSGDVPLGDLPIDVFMGGGAPVDYGKVWSRLMPVFRKYRSALVRDVAYSLSPTPCVNGTPAGAPCPSGAWDLRADAGFTSRDLTFDGVPLGFSFAASVPDLPRRKGAYVNGALVVGAVDMPGRGTVVLGIGLGVNTAGNLARVDMQANLPREGLMLVRMAPTHAGFEGLGYRLMAVARPVGPITPASGPLLGEAASVIFTGLPGNQLKFDPAGATPSAFSVGFLDFPEGARFNFTTTAQAGLPPRTFKLALPSGLSLGGASAIRAVFTDDLAHRWVVVTSVAEAIGANGVRLPSPPSAYADRTWAGGAAGTGARSRMLVQAQRLARPSTGGAVTFTDLVELNDTNPERVKDLLTGLSHVDYARPEVAWLSPSTPGATVPRSGTVTVKVTGFTVGSTADGRVRLSFPGNSNCPDIDALTDTSGGKGEVVISLASLPSSCTGAVTMKSMLLDTAAAPLAPEVSASIAATLQ